MNDNFVTIFSHRELLIVDYLQYSDYQEYRNRHSECRFCLSHVVKNNYRAEKLHDWDNHPRLSNQIVVGMESNRKFDNVVLYEIHFSLDHFESWNKTETSEVSCDNEPAFFVILSAFAIRNSGANRVSIALNFN